MLSNALKALFFDSDSDSDSDMQCNAKWLSVFLQYITMAQIDQKEECHEVGDGNQKSQSDGDQQEASCPDETSRWMFLPWSPIEWWQLDGS